MPEHAIADLVVAHSGVGGDDRDVRRTELETLAHGVVVDRDRLGDGPRSGELLELMDVVSAVVVDRRAVLRGIFIKIVSGAKSPAVAADDDKGLPVVRRIIAFSFSGLLSVSQQTCSASTS